MNADRQALEQIRLSLLDAIEKLETSGAPSSVASQVQLALSRLNSFLAMIDKWEATNKQPD